MVVCCKIHVDITLCAPNAEFLFSACLYVSRRLGLKGLANIYIYSGADKSLARPGRKQARKHVRDVRDFNNIETRAVIKFFSPPLQSKAPKEIHAILTETLPCLLPGRAKDLSAPLCKVCLFVTLSYYSSFFFLSFFLFSFFLSFFLSFLLSFFLSFSNATLRC